MMLVRGNSLVGIKGEIKSKILNGYDKAEGAMIIVLFVTKKSCSFITASHKETDQYHG